MSPARALLFQCVLAQMSYVIPPPPSPALRGDLGRLQRSLPGARVWNNEGTCLIGCFRVFMTNTSDYKGINILFSAAATLNE